MSVCTCKKKHLLRGNCDPGYIEYILYLFQVNVTSVIKGLSQVVLKYYLI